MPMPLSASILIRLVRTYQFMLSPYLGAQCRFTPTCSHYAIEALAKHGTTKGCILTARRVLRCHPWCQGGYDPVP